MKNRSRAFTLVELLVVIGIISVLIGILLPALNKARQQANLVSCSARLHSIGQVLQIYESESKGLIPMADIPQANQTPANEEPFWWWEFALGDLMNPGMISPSDGLVHNLSKVFTDVDTINTNNFRYVCHYTVNPRVFNSSALDFGYCTLTGANYYSTDKFKTDVSVNRKSSDVKNQANVFAVWDAPQAADQNYNAYGIPEGVDAFAWYNNGMVLNDPLSTGTLRSDLASWPTSANGGVPGISDGKAAQKKYNFDPVSVYGGSPNWLYLRFRHMNNTRLAALCLDGHVETRAVGTVTRKDIYTNVPGSSGN